MIIIYKDNIEPPLDGETFVGLAAFSEYDDKKIAPVLAGNGFQSSFPPEPASFEVPVTKDGVSYNLGVAECELVITGAAKYAELSRNYAKTESGFEVTINYDNKPLPIEGTTDVYKIPRITIVERLIATGDFDAVIAKIDASRAATEAWKTITSVHTNHTLILQVLAAGGADASVILSPVGIDP